MNEQQEKIYGLMSRKLAGEATKEELEELDGLIAEFPELQYAFSMVSDLSPLPKPGDPPTADELARKERGARRLQQMLDAENAVTLHGQDAGNTAAPALHTPDTEDTTTPVRHAPGVEKRPASIPHTPGVENRPASVPNTPDAENTAPPVRRIQRRLQWVAAASVAVLAGVSALWWLPGRQHTTQVVMETNKGTRENDLTLPDGTTVKLNAGSRLLYDEEGLANGRREVTLEGEGFFNVKADEQHPFVIKTGKVDIRVLGTTFNLKAYPKDNRVETFLISGKVEVAYNDNGKETRRQLTPRQRFIVNLPAVEVAGAAPGLPPVVLKTALAGEEAPEAAAALQPGWLKGRLELENVTFEQLANELERWYDVTIVIKNDQLKKEVFTGTFDSKTLPEVLFALQYTLQFKFKMLDDGETVELW